MYNDIQFQQEAKVSSQMKDNPKAFFKFVKYRQKSRAKVGSFMDPNNVELNLEQDYTAECLIKQYSSVFTQPHSEGQFLI